MNLSPSPITSSFDSATHRGPPPRQLAFALATLEEERYQRILPTEYVAHAGRQPLYCPNLLAAIALNETVNNWVQSSILDLEFDGGWDELKRRSEIKRYFVQTAQVICAFRTCECGCLLMFSCTGLSDDPELLVVGHHHERFAVGQCCLPHFDA
jgi:hypothetical protein